jgi:hypothetical protein
MVGALAAEITGRLGFIYNVLGIEDGLTNRLRTAERGNSPVVLITDVWSLGAPNIRRGKARSRRDRERFRHPHE